MLNGPPSPTTSGAATRPRFLRVSTLLRRSPFRRIFSSQVLTPQHCLPGHGGERMQSRRLITLRTNLDLILRRRPHFAMESPGTFCTSTPCTVVRLHGGYGQEHSTRRHF